MMFPKGFKLGGISCGLSAKEGKKDLALFISEKPSAVAAVFTSNIVKAAPVLVDLEILKTSKKISAIIANSGCANACTGKKGIDNTVQTIKTVEQEFGFQKGSVLCASTGVIGEQIKLENLKAGIKTLKNKIGISDLSQDDAVLAIMTTDTRIKRFSREVKIKDGKIIIWGCVKGSGMIHPTLCRDGHNKLHATMLSFILTDANIGSKTLQAILETATCQSFNCTSVDGDTSTNDTVIVLANAASKTQPLSKSDLLKFTQAFNELTLDLAKAMVKDGEGAGKLAEIEVKNAKSKTDAKIIAQTIATSPLVKTALFGADANWGRIIAAAGRAGINFNPDKTDIFIGGIKVFKNGAPIKFDEKAAKKALNKAEIKIILDLHCGLQTSKYYACDFSYDYVKINASYRS